MEGLPSHCIQSILLMCEPADVLQFERTSRAFRAIAADDAVWRPRCRAVATRFNNSVTPDAWECTSYRQLYLDVLYHCRDLPGIWSVADTCFGGVVAIRPEPPTIKAYAVVAQALNGPSCLEHVWTVHPKLYSAEIRRRAANRAKRAALSHVNGIAGGSSHQPTTPGVPTAKGIESGELGEVLQGHPAAGLPGTNETAGQVAAPEGVELAMDQSESSDVRGERAGNDSGDEAQGGEPGVSCCHTEAERWGRLRWRGRACPDLGVVEREPARARLLHDAQAMSGLANGAESGQDWKILTFACAHRLRHMLPYTLHRFRRPSVAGVALAAAAAPQPLPPTAQGPHRPPCTCCFPEVDPERFRLASAQFMLTFVNHIQTPSAWGVAGRPDISIESLATPQQHMYIRTPLPLTEAGLRDSSPPAHPLEGLWRGTYGSHGIEMLMFTRIPIATPAALVPPGATSSDQPDQSLQPAPGASTGHGAGPSRGASSISAPAGSSGSSNGALISGGVDAGEQSYRLCGIKLVGDANVLAGTVTLEVLVNLPPLANPTVKVGSVFRPPLGYRALVSVPSVMDVEDEAEDDDEPGLRPRPLVVASVHRARGQIAGEGFNDPQWTPVELIAFRTECEAHGDPRQVQVFGVLWHALNSFSLFTRVHLDSLCDANALV